MFHQNDQLVVTCTYVNNTGSPIIYSDGAGGEMCFTGIYRWLEHPDPTDPLNAAMFCVNN
jgi:hypothetical protein